MPLHPGIHELNHRTATTRSLEEVFTFFSEPGNLELLTPPELRFRILTPSPLEMRAGTLIDYRLSLMGIGFRWRTLISQWEPPHRFVDEQIKGPYREWHHTHTFEETGDGTVIVDRVRYRLPLYPLGEIALPVVRLQLKRIFSFRERRIHELLGR